MSMPISIFKKRLKKQNAKTQEAIKRERLDSRFLYGSHNKTRLNKSLATAGKHHLQDITLLSPAVHEKHAKRLAGRYLKKFMASKAAAVKRGRSRIYSAATEFRFLTLIHSVELLGVDPAIKAVRQFKTQLEDAIASSRGIWCLGAIELEVISMEMMRQIAGNSDESEKRKLGVCEGLLRKLPKHARQLPSFFLIHFHGIVHGINPERFFKFEQHLKRNKNWKSEPRQIQMKTLSTNFAGKKKKPERNLTDIARYITKGGNNWVGDKAYLRYKLGFDNEIEETEDGWVNRNWRRNITLKGEHREDGIEDTLSMEQSEIVVLTEVIDAIMSWKRDRTGYLVSGKSKKLTTTGLQVLRRNPSADFG